MFIDLGKDWAAGPPSDYQRFVPVVYAVEFEMHHFELNMYANDHNIIDKPLIRDENGKLLLVLRRWPWLNAACKPFSLHEEHTSFLQSKCL